jgi:predicted metal-binding membrane protein
MHAQPVGFGRGAFRAGRRSSLVLIGALLGIAAVAWALTRSRMLGMDAGPGTDPGTLSFYVGTWVVMMIAMMFPSIAPMVLTFEFVQRRRRERAAVQRVVSVWVFVAGYVIVWTVFGLLAYGAYKGVRSLDIHALAWHRGGRYLAGGVLVAAAAYQLTPAKDACLRRCRGPLDFLMTEWREGSLGALRMGFVHGAWCVGCCWALMASLFALGVMSIPWMILLAAMIAIEKLLPWKALANRIVAATLVVLGLWVVLAPDSLPGLTLPGSAQARAAMRAMSGGSMGTMKPGTMGTKHAPSASMQSGTTGMGGNPSTSMPKAGTTSTTMPNAK